MKKIIKSGALTLLFTTPLLLGMQKDDVKTTLLWDILEKTTYAQQLDTPTIEKYATQIREICQQCPEVVKSRKNMVCPLAFAQQKCYHAISSVLIGLYKENLLQKKMLNYSSNKKSNPESSKLPANYAEKLTNLCRDLIKNTVEKKDEPNYAVHQLKDEDTEIKLTIQKNSPCEWNFTLVLDSKTGMKKELGRAEFLLIKNDIRSELHIAKLFIAKKERNRGLGRALLSTINNAKLLCSKNGIDITLTAQPLVNKELKLFMGPILIDYYQSFGFSTINNSKNHMLMRIDKTGKTISPYDLQKEHQEKIENVTKKFGKNLFTEFDFNN